MKKKEFLDQLKHLHDWIQVFQKKKLGEIINIDWKDIEKEIQNDPKRNEQHRQAHAELQHAIESMAYRKLSGKRKELLYSQDKSKLKNVYGRLKPIICLFSEKPAINNISCYDAFFLDDNWSNEDNSYKPILSDIQIMIGKIELLSEREFFRRTKTGNTNLWRSLNPIWWIYLGWIFLWRNKIFSFLWVTLGGILITDIFTPIVDELLCATREFFKSIQ